MPRFAASLFVALAMAVVGFGRCADDDDVIPDDQSPTLAPEETDLPGTPPPPEPTPAATPDVTPTPAGPSDSIYDIQQGLVPTGTPVRLVGVVVTGQPTPWGDMFVQDIQGGPWSGIHVSIDAPDGLTLEPGDLVTLEGVYNEAYGESTVFVARGQDVHLVGTVDPVAPVLVDPDRIATGGEEAEAYEGVLVRVTNVTCTDDNPDDPEDYGEFTVTGGLRVDDLYFDYYERIAPAVGDTFDEIAGVLHYSWGNFKLEPRSAFDIDPERTLPADPAGSGLFVVTFIDVWQGDSALLELPDGTTILIDGGDNGHGNQDVLQVMERRGVFALDLVVLTHPHADHVGGLDEVLEQVPVGAVWENGETVSTTSYEAFEEARSALGIPVFFPEQGYETWFSGVHLLVMNTNEGYGGENNDSLVIQFTYGDTRLLTTGDVEIAEQQDLVRDYGNDLASDVIKVPHHGSPNYDTTFIRTVSPDYAVISVGEGNDYGHPDDGNIAAYQAAGAVVCRTDTSGDIMAVMDGRNVQFYCLHPEP